MGIITYNATMFSRQHTKTTNHLTDRAGEGAYNTMDSSLVGILYFNGMNLSNKTIKSITFTTTCVSGAGAGNGSTKKLTFWASKTQSLTNSVSGKGSTFIGSELGSLSGTNFYDASNISRPVAAGSTLFNNLASYLQSGNNTLIIYVADNVPSSGYSTNYLFIDVFKITIEYLDATVYVGVDGEWVTCEVYYGNNGAWVKCIPYYGTGGVWTQV